MSIVSKIVSLLRSGALEQAEKEYLRLGLDKDQSSEDVIALGGRILKAKALEHKGADRQRLALMAAEKYAAAHTRFGGTFSGINTAALYLVGSQPDKAQAAARGVQKSLKSKSPKPGADAYYHMATAAEAAFILDDRAQANTMLADALPLDPHNHEAHASTLKQLEMLSETTGAPIDWLTPFRPPKSLHFAGHLFALGDSDLALEGASVYGLEKAIDDELKAGGYGAAYGALAAGSDILIAERLLAHGIDLHVVQPCPDQLFEDISIKPFGDEWQARFEACLASAASVRTISRDTSVCDDLTTAFASETAMGLAVLRSENLATTAEQLLIWDGTEGRGVSGTARDAVLWRASGRYQRTIPYAFKRNITRTDRNSHNPSRSLKAMLFADVKGFGKLNEKQVPIFVEKVLTPLASHFGGPTEKPAHMNTWGDGLFLVFDTVTDAANAAVKLQATFQEIVPAAIGLPEGLALRVGGHYGPVHSLTDPFMNRNGVFGREVTTAARIEPVTAPGSIFVSEPFACALALTNPEGLHCEPLREAVPDKDGNPMTLFSLRKTNRLS